MIKGMGLVFSVIALPVATLAQDQATPGLTGPFSNTPELAQQFAEDRQYLANTLQDTRNAVIALTAIDGDMFAPGYPQTGAGFSKRLSEHSEAQSRFIEEYADMMALRTEALFDFWQDANDQHSVTFFQTGSIYSIIVTGPDIEPPKEPSSPIDAPDAFPGLEPPVGGFFAEATN